MAFDSNGVGTEISDRSEAPSGTWVDEWDSDDLCHCDAGPPHDPGKHRWEESTLPNGKPCMTVVGLV